MSSSAGLQLGAHLATFLSLVAHGLVDLVLRRQGQTRGLHAHHKQLQQTAAASGNDKLPETLGILLLHQAVDLVRDNIQLSAQLGLASARSVNSLASPAMIM